MTAGRGAFLSVELCPGGAAGRGASAVEDELEVGLLSLSKEKEKPVRLMDGLRRGIRAMPKLSIADDEETMLF